MTEISEKDLAALGNRLGYEFRDSRILLLALTHCSYTERAMNETTHNQRLEFLGDAVLQLYSSALLYSMFPVANESMLSQARASLVCEGSLARFARSLNIGEMLLLGKGEEHNNARDRDSMLADTMEAIIGAIYLDGGEEPAKKLIESLLRPYADSAMIPDRRPDAKTTLQMKLADSGDVTYVIVGESGPDHAKVFTAEARLCGRTLGRGVAATKKNAEKNAAKNALTELFGGHDAT